MRVMGLPGLRKGPASVSECGDLYLQRLDNPTAPDAVPGLLLMAYMTWPDDEGRRMAWMASQLALNPHLNGPQASPLGLVEQFGGMRVVAEEAVASIENEAMRAWGKWPLAAHIFQLVVDLAHDRAIPSGGASVSKAIDLAAWEKETPPGSKLRAVWSRFRDVVHLLAAARHLALRGLDTAGPRGGSMYAVTVLAPEAVVSLAAGYQEFGLGYLVRPQGAPILRPEELWIVPGDLVPDPAPLLYRKLTADQRSFLQTRRAAKRR